MLNWEPLLPSIKHNTLVGAVAVIAYTNYTSLTLSRLGYFSVEIPRLRKIVIDISPGGTTGYTC